MTIFKYRGGFTLLETVIALSVITAAVVGPVYLIISGLFSSGYSRNKIVANNLAQEGLEAVRLVRENNVICSFLKEDTSYGWLTNSTGSGSLVGSNLKIDANQTDSISCNGETLLNAQVRANCNEVLKIDSNGRYGYTAGTDTIFQRCINISRPGAGEGVIPAGDIADVVVIVTWNERGSTKNTTINSRVYNWK